MLKEEIAMVEEIARRVAKEEIALALASKPAPKVKPETAEVKSAEDKKPSGKK